MQLTAKSSNASRPSIGFCIEPLIGSKYVRLRLMSLDGEYLRLTLDENKRNRLRRLSSSGSRLEFLGYVVDLDSGEFYGSLRGTADFSNVEFEVVQVLLSHYSKAEPVERAGKLVKFAGLPGGHAYERAFLQRAVQPIADVFGDEPEKLVEAAERLNGRVLGYGDFSVEIPALPRIPLVIVLWRADEFPASATILYDKSASSYLPTEDLAVLGELTTARLLQALNSSA